MRLRSIILKEPYTSGCMSCYLRMYKLCIKQDQTQRERVSEVPDSSWYGIRNGKVWKISVMDRKGGRRLRRKKIYLQMVASYPGGCVHTHTSHTSHHTSATARLLFFLWRTHTLTHTRKKTERTCLIPFPFSGKLPILGRTLIFSPQE